MEMKKYKLGDIADINKQTLSKKDSMDVIEYLDTGSLTENIFGPKQVLSRKEAPSRAQRRVFDKTILYSTVRPRLKHYGFLESPKENTIVSTGFATIDVKDEFKNVIDARYLYLLLIQDKVTEYLGTIADTAVSAYPSLNPSDIQSLEFEFPDMPIQKKVASFLCNIDKRIENLRAQNRVLEQTAKTIYDYTFLQCAGRKTTYNKTLNRNIPANWEVKKLGEILDKVPATTKIETKLYQQSGKYPIIDQSTNFIAGYTDDESAVIRKTPAVFFGDHTRIVKMINFAFARGSDGTQILYSKENTVGPHYLYFAVKSIELPNMGYARHFKFLKDKSIAIPDKNTSDSFEKIIQPLFDKILINRKQIETLTTQRNTLLPLLMTGQVEVC